MADLAPWLTATFAALTLGRLLIIDIPGVLRHGVAHFTPTARKDR